MAGKPRRDQPHGAGTGLGTVAIHLRGGRAAAAEWFGRLVTERAGPDVAQELEKVQLRACIEAGAGLVVAPAARLAYFESGAATILFCNGVDYAQAVRAGACASSACARRGAW